LELRGLKYGGILSIQTGLLKIRLPLHKMGLVQTEIATAVSLIYTLLIKKVPIFLKGVFQI